MRAELTKAGRLPSGGRLFRLVFALVFLAAHAAMAFNLSHLIEDVLYGSGAGERMIVKPRYGFMRIPDTDLTRQTDAVGRITGDFAQVYFPVRGPAKAAYSGDSLDPFGRPSRLTPFVHHACAWTICRLNYGPASLAHVSIQYLVFMASLVFAFATLKVTRYLPLGILVANTCLFLMPVGLAWAERGQFSLYVAAAYLWLMLALIRRNAVFAALSAVLAYAKLTSLPFILVASGFWLSGLRGKTAVEGLKLIAVPAFVLGILFLVYFEEGRLFLWGALRQEYVGSPEGLTLLGPWPRHLVKAMPFVLLALGGILARRLWTEFSCGFPFLIGAAIMLLLYPTKAYDYSVPTLLGFIPLLFWWAGLRANQGRYRTPVVVWGFILFLALASLSGTVLIHYPLSEHMISIYLFFGVLFMLLSLFRGPACRSVSDS